MVGVGAGVKCSRSSGGSQVCVVFDDVIGLTYFFLDYHIWFSTSFGNPKIT